MIRMDPHQLTRRTLFRHSGLAVSASALCATIAEQAMAEKRDSTVFHVFAFEWKSGTSEALKRKAAQDISAFQGMIPGLLETHVGPNISPRGKGYTFGGIMRFKDQGALDAYVKHPAHQALLSWLVPLIGAIELDLPA